MMNSESELIKKRYDRIAPYYEMIEAMMEGLFFKSWRKKLWSKVVGHHILEVGVGTGKNFEYYPPKAQITSIDFSPKMLKQASLKKEHKAIRVNLDLMDIQSLAFADNSFDTVIASFVFCSVPHPLKGLKELYRVCKPGGQVLLLEHMISNNSLLAKVMNFVNPIILNLVGANINRNTLRTIKAAGFAWVIVDQQSSHLIKLIEARK